MEFKPAIRVLAVCALIYSHSSFAEYFSGTILRPAEGNELETDYASAAIWEDASILQIWTNEYHARLVHWSDSPGGTAYELGLYFSVTSDDDSETTQILMLRGSFLAGGTKRVFQGEAILFEFESMPAAELFLFHVESNLKQEDAPKGQLIGVFNFYSKETSVLSKSMTEPNES